MGSGRDVWCGKEGRGEERGRGVRGSGGCRRLERGSEGAREGLESRWGVLGRGRLKKGQTFASSQTLAGSLSRPPPAPLHPRVVAPSSPAPLVRWAAALCLPSWLGCHASPPSSPWRRGRPPDGPAAREEHASHAASRRCGRVWRGIREGKGAISNPLRSSTIMPFILIPSLIASPLQHPKPPPNASSPLHLHTLKLPPSLFAAPLSFIKM